jgi:hypothetical protein
MNGSVSQWFRGIKSQWKEKIRDASNGGIGEEARL